MTLGRNMSVTTVSSMPCVLRSSTMYSMHGLPHRETIGLGWLLVSGRRRVPSPPAMTTARTHHLGCSGDCTASVPDGAPRPASDRGVCPATAPRPDHDLVAVPEAAGDVER